MLFLAIYFIIGFVISSLAVKYDKSQRSEDGIGSWFFLIWFAWPIVWTASLFISYIKWLRK
jgi:ABC-type polysaccharide/polyol phosphate export permease